MNLIIINLWRHTLSPVRALVQIAAISICMVSFVFAQPQVQSVTSSKTAVSLNETFNIEVQVKNAGSSGANFDIRVAEPTLGGLGWQIQTAPYNNQSFSSGQIRSFNFSVKATNIGQNTLLGQAKPTSDWFWNNPSQLSTQVTATTNATLTVVPRYAGYPNPASAWDNKTWELLVDGISRGTSTGNKSVTVTTGSHKIKGRIKLGSYVADTKEYDVNVPNNGASKEIWWDKIGITVKYNGQVQTSGYSLMVNNQSQSSPLDHTVLGDGAQNIPIKCTWTVSAQFINENRSYTTFGGQHITFNFTEPTLTVEPRYAGYPNPASAWDNKAWELFVDDVSKGTSTSSKSVTVTTGSHKIKGRIKLGSYVADTKEYDVNVPNNGATKEVRWDKIGITVKYNGQVQTNGYTLQVNNQSQSSPLNHTVLGDGASNIPIKCTWTASGESKTENRSYTTFGGQNITFEFFQPTLTVEPRYAGYPNPPSAWDNKTWELFVDGVSKGTSTGNNNVTVSTGNHTIKGRIKLGSYVADTQEYNINVPNNGATTQVWWDKIGITVKYNGQVQTSGYSLMVNNQSQSSPLDHTVLGDGAQSIPIKCTWTASGDSKTENQSYSTLGGQHITFAFFSTSAKIIGIVQNQHNSRTAPIGFQIAVHITADFDIQHVYLEWDNLDDGILQGPFAPEFNNLGDGYWKIEINKSIPIIGQFSSGNRIQWRIKAVGSNGAVGYYPSQSTWEMTKVLSYDLLNSNISVETGSSGFVSVEDKLAENGITIKNNKSVFLKVLVPNSLQAEGDPLFSAFKVLSPHSLPFGLASPPEISVSGISSLPDDTPIDIEIRKLGDTEVAIFTITDAILKFAAIDETIITGSEYALLLIDLYELVKDIVLPLLEGNGYELTDEILREALSQLANDFQQHPETWAVIFSNAGKAELGERVINACIKASLAVTVADLAIMLYDYAVPFVHSDFVTITKSSGHFVKVTPQNIQDNISSGSPQIFSFELKNTSNEHNLYNIWFSMDVLAPGIDAVYRKVAETKSPINIIGTIDFGAFQGIDLPRNNSFILSSHPFLFDENGFPSNKKPYQIRYSVFTNGYPDQTQPLTSWNLVSSKTLLEFYVTDNVPPDKPTLSIERQNSNGSAVYWHVNNEDIKDLKRILVVTVQL